MATPNESKWEFRGQLLTQPATFYCSLFYCARLLPPCLSLVYSRGCLFESASATGPLSQRGGLLGVDVALLAWPLLSLRYVHHMLLGTQHDFTDKFILG